MNTTYHMCLLRSVISCRNKVKVILWRQMHIAKLHVGLCCDKMTDADARMANWQLNHANIKTWKKVALNRLLKVIISVRRPHVEHLGARMQWQMEEVPWAEAALLHGLCKFMLILIHFTVLLGTINLVRVRAFYDTVLYKDRKQSDFFYWNVILITCVCRLIAIMGRRCWRVTSAVRL